MGVGTVVLGAGCLCLLAQAPRPAAAQSTSPSSTATSPSSAAGAGSTPSEPPIVGSLSFGPAGGLPFPVASSTVAILHYVISCSDGQSFKGTLTGSGEIKYPDVPAGTTCTVNPTPAPGLSDAAPRAFPPVPAGGVSSVSYAEGAPQIVASPPDGPPGRPTTVYGVNFPPDRTVTVTWPSNLQAPVSDTTNSAGQLVMNIYVLPNSALGNLQIVATGTGFGEVSTDYLVVAPTVEAFGAKTEVAFRS